MIHCNLGRLFTRTIPVTMPYQIWISELPQKGERGLTLNQGYNVDPPSACYYPYNNFLLFPNGNAGGDCEYLIRSDR